MEGNFIIYEDEGNIKIDVLLEEDNVWLSQSQMSNLFGKSKKNNKRAYHKYTRRERTR